MKYADRMAFVQARVMNRVSRFGYVMRAWQLVPNFVPDARYRMFNRSADELIGSWECPAMQELAPSLSEPIVDSE